MYLQYRNQSIFLFSSRVNFSCLNKRFDVYNYFIFFRYRNVISLLTTMIWTLYFWIKRFFSWNFRYVFVSDMRIFCCWTINRCNRFKFFCFNFLLCFSLCFSISNNIQQWVYRSMNSFSQQSFHSIMMKTTRNWKTE